MPVSRPKATASRLVPLAGDPSAPKAPRPTLRCSEGGGLVTETGRRSNRRAWTARNTCKLPQAPRQSLSGPRRPIRKATGPEPDFLSEVRVRFLVSGPGRATISLSNSRAPSSVIHENYRPGYRAEVVAALARLWILSKSSRYSSC